MTITKAFGYYFTKPGEAFKRDEFLLSDPMADEAIVEVAGCGLCHTDLAFYSGEVKTKAALPLILGHEISGRVVDAGVKCKHLVGRNVIVPAVLPCGLCEFCKNSRSNICRNQKMPGNDFNGGFASHSIVPGRFLCVLPADLGGFKVSDLCVIADAVTTPYQSILRSNLKSGEVAIVIGVGGIGVYMVQLAARMGAVVIALDIEDSKIERAKQFGAAFGINVAEMNERDIRSAVSALSGDWKLPKTRWKVFETSGTAVGQSAAFSLLSYAGTIAIVGFTMDKVTIRLSNLMAFDADMFGTWGCRPEHYPAVVDMVLNKELNILDTIEEHPLASIDEIVSQAMRHKLEKRVVFKP